MQFYHGERVTHRLHGDGTVLNNSDQENDPAVVTIRFDDPPDGKRNVFTVYKRNVTKLPVEARG